MNLKITTDDGIEHTFGRGRPTAEDIQRFIDKSSQVLADLINEANGLNIDVLFASAIDTEKQVWCNTVYAGNAYLITDDLVDCMVTHIEKQMENIEKYL